MNATSEPGKWEERFSSDTLMIVDTTLSEIIIQVNGKDPIKNHYPEGVRISDVIKTREHILSSIINTQSENGN